MIHKSGYALTGSVLFLLWFVILSVTAHTAHGAVRAGRLPVPGKAAIFDAGQTVPTLDGLLAPVFQLPTGVGRHLQITSISGSVTNILGARAFVGPNGYVGKLTDLNQWNGISGIKAPSKLFLAGVFLNDSLPTDPAPSKLNFNTIGVDFPSIAPQLNQTFYIGDGLTTVDNGEPQRFIIPDGATRLFLGFGDGFNFVGDPGAYHDNYGYLDTRFKIVGSALTGDLDADGFTGIADLNIVLSHWNQNVTPGDFLMGDPSGNGFVGLEDLNVVLGNWNAGIPPTPPAAGSTVPEPTTLSLFALISLVSIGWRR